jgi:hypothetical protein
MSALAEARTVGKALAKAPASEGASDDPAVQLDHHHA